MRALKSNGTAAILVALIAVPIAALSFSISSSTLTMAVRILSTTVATAATAYAFIAFAEINIKSTESGRAKIYSTISLVLFMLGAPFAAGGGGVLYYAINYGYRLENARAWLEGGALAMLIGTPFWFGAWWFGKGRT